MIIKLECFLILAPVLLQEWEAQSCTVPQNEEGQMSNRRRVDSRSNSLTVNHTWFNKQAYIYNIPPALPWYQFVPILKAHELHGRRTFACLSSSFDSLWNQIPAHDMLFNMTWVQCTWLNLEHLDLTQLCCPLVIICQGHSQHNACN